MTHPGSKRAISFNGAGARIGCGLLLLMNLCTGVRAAGPPSSSTPLRANILFILCDDLGYGDLGVLWQNDRTETKKFTTPNLDQMAAEGTILNRHYCGAPVCAPSRSSLLAGVHQGHAFVRNTDFDDALGHNHTLASTLRTAGYATALVGKYGLQGDGNSPATWTAYPTRRGFDFFHGYVRHSDGHQHYPANSWPLGNSAAHRSAKPLYENAAEISGDLDKCFTPDLFTARAKKWLVDHHASNPSQPFFLYLAFDTPHAALQLPTQAYPAGSGTIGGLQYLGTPGAMINTASGTIDSWRHPDYTGRGWSDEEERFATLVRRMDDCVGDLLQTLHDLSVATNTLVVFTADNGPHTEHYIAGGSYNARAFDSFGPFEGVKRDCLEGGIRQPTLAWWPGTVPSNRVDNTPSQFHDWMPTFCELAGVPAPSRSDGVSLAPTLTGSGAQREGVVYVEFNQGGSAPTYPEFVHHGGDPRGNQQVIYVDGYKGIRNGISSHADDFQIYDVSVDLAEGTNLYLNPPPGQAAIFTALQQRMKDRVLQVRRVERDDAFGSSTDKVQARPYDNEQIPPVTALVTNGLAAAAYEGTWPWVPQFEALVPVSTTTVAAIDVAVDLSRATHAGLHYTGYLDVPASGSWTFYATSDAGMHLRLHDVQVIDDDFNHDGSEASSGAILLEAGLHPFSLSYRTTTNAPSLQLRWEGPGTPKQLLPASALYLDLAAGPDPLARDDTAETLQDTPVTINVLANDLDDGDPSPLSIAAVGTPAAGTNHVVGGGIEYGPDPGFLGTDSFSYAITDGASTSEAVVNVSVVFPGPDIWLPLNETSGVDVFEAGGARAGEMTGFDHIAVAHIDGRHGKALAFDGDDAQVNLPGLPALPIGDAPRTAMAWIQVQPGGSPENQGIFAYGPNISGRRFTFRLDTTGTQRPRLEVQHGNIIGNTALDDGAWHHLAVVCDDFDGDGILEIEESKFYVDGVLDTNPADTAEPLIAASAFDPEVMDTAFGTAVLGAASHAGNFHFDGNIDEFRLFSSALSAAQIAQYAAASHQAAAAWHRRHFGNEAVDWAAHDDGDPANRLLEYGMGGQPHIDDASQFQLRPDVVADRLRITYPRRIPGSHDLTYELELTRDFSDWDTLTASLLETVSIPGQPDLESVTMQTDATATAESLQAGRVHIEVK